MSTDLIVKLTCAKAGQGLQKGQPIHVNFHRVQAMWVVQDKNMTRLEMNVVDPATQQPLTYYVTEPPKEIYKLLGKNDD